ncbi:TonB-dependent receptor [Paremcibacter congregatus]|uniref:TonB-dependent receptor n=1 Tax=Paremcibacter congregatus TaxID=2043170 RepID=UPI003A9135EE
MRSRKSILLGSVGALVVMSGPAAISAASAQEEVAELEEVVVTGIRAGLRQALDVKRNSDAIVDAISSEDIGKFPDKNVAESLQRVPGVTIQRQFGEGSGVSIRGAGADFTLTSLNGQNVASTGWFVFEPGKRSFNYELLPSELVGNIEVYKSSQADLAEGGVGGTVIINTRKPLDMPSMSLYASIEGQHQTDSDSIDPQGSALFSWKSEEENFGILVSGVYQKRNLQRQGNEAFWEWGAGPVGFQQNRERMAFTGTVQYQPNENLDLTFNYVNMQMEANNTNYALWITQNNCSWCGNPDDYSNAVNGSLRSGQANVAYSQLRPREATMKSQVYDFDLTYNGEGYQIDFQAGHTNSTGGTDFETEFFDATGGLPIHGSSYDFTDGHQTWNLVETDWSTYDPGALELNLGLNNSKFNKTPKTDKETYAQFDLEYDVEWGAINSVKTGVKWSSHNNTSRQIFFQTADGFNPVISTAGLQDGLIDVGAGDYQIIKFDAEALKDFAKAAVVGETEDLGTYSEIDEKNFAGYGMVSFSGDGFRGNAGLRITHTSAKSTYYLNSTLTESKEKYTEFLPSVNVAMDLADDVIFRASAARVMTRPQYIDMYVNPSPTGGTDDNPNNQFWTVGNVGLKPFVSNQIDLSVEWYFAEGSIFSAGFFLKDVKNFVTTTDRHATAAEIPFTLNPDEIPFGWTVQEKNNGKTAMIKGFEVQFQQEFANGFGAIVNYTFTDSQADEGSFADGNTVVSDSSKHTYNVSGYYEGDSFSTRLSYNYRSKYMLRETGAYGNRLQKGYGSLDMTASYYVTDEISINLDVNNILRQNAEQFGNNVEPTSTGFSRGFPLYEYETARRITLGVSARF